MTRPVYIAILMAVGIAAACFLGPREVGRILFRQAVYDGARELRHHVK